jgi:hypothetical protein
LAAPMKILIPGFESALSPGTKVTISIT